jgi:hypothetical protein
MMDDAEKRGQLIRYLEDALALADEIEDGHTGYLIERALDEARSRQFKPINLSRSAKALRAPRPNQSPPRGVEPRAWRLVRNIHALLFFQWFSFSAKSLNAKRAKPPATTRAIQLTDFGRDQPAIRTGQSI